MKSKRTKQKLDSEVELQKLGTRLKDVRIAKGHSNKDIFAAMNNIHPSQYSRYERGNDIQYSTLIKVLNALEISVGEFFREGFG